MNEASSPTHDSPPPSTPEPRPNSRSAPRPPAPPTTSPRRHAWSAARAISTRWYDHQQHLTHRWHTRLTQLCAAKAHLATAGSASPVLLTRDLVIHPETVTLARTLTTPPDQPHRTADDALALIARRLGLARLAPAVHDPLRAWLTPTRR
ncbi:hypothetical protein [Streptomyces cellostaticus]|uniref:hypothetical protein n=1 Tax=Streptomyces cellostaticus TaxID=67285 RepID=UPI000AD32CAA|nr:hypothetical protein [Streptomyces cellostaticus]GHI01743.1 hypothetical protein Scel_00640 [Streptomyces cellostaticus]